MTALPARLRAEREMPGASDAVVGAHFPMGADEASIARERLAFEELLLHQVALASARMSMSPEPSPVAWPAAGAGDAVEGAGDELSLLGPPVASAAHALWLTGWASTTVSTARAMSRTSTQGTQGRGETASAPHSFCWPYSQVRAPAL